MKPGEVKILCKRKLWKKFQHGSIKKKYFLDLTFQNFTVWCLIQYNIKIIFILPSESSKRYYFTANKMLWLSSEIWFLMKPTNFATFQLWLHLWSLADIGSTIFLFICEYDLKFNFKRISTAWTALPAAAPSIPPRLSWLKRWLVWIPTPNTHPKSLGGAQLWHQIRAQQPSYGFQGQNIG